MKVKDIIESAMADAEASSDEDLIKYIDVILPEALIPGDVLTLESVWRDSGYKDWVYRVDAEKQNISQQRHIHIAREKHKNSKNMQASWNEDGTRHDRKSFNAKTGSIRAVRDIATKVLGLGANVVLGSMTKNYIPLTESITFIAEDSALMSVGYA